MTTIHNESFADLEPETLYALLRLRVDVFVVEQKAAYPELDGRDHVIALRHDRRQRGIGPTSGIGNGGSAHRTRVRNQNQADKWGDPH